MQSHTDLNFTNTIIDNMSDNIDDNTIDKTELSISNCIQPGDDNIIKLEINEIDYDQNINLEIISDDAQIDWNTTDLMINNRSLINIFDNEDEIKTLSDTNSDSGLLFNIKKLELNDISFFPNNEHFINFKLPFDNDNDDNITNSNDKDFNFFGSEFSFGDQDNEEQEEDEEEEEEDDQEEEDDDEEYENTLDTIKKLVENQLEVRKLMLKEIVKGYLKPFKDNETFRISFVLATTQQIKKIVKILNMENEVIEIIADILFNKKIVEDMQVYNYKSLLKPFLENSSSQRNFLNFILKFVNKHKQLINIDNINDIFQEIYSNKLVHSFVFVNWYHTLNNSSLHKKLEIDFGITDAVFNYLEDIIFNLEH